MLRALAVLALLLLPGCLQGGSYRATNATIAPETFEDANARPLVTVVTQCGLCGRIGSFATESAYTAFFLFENNRVLLVDFNLQPRERGLHLDHRIRYEGSDLRTLLADIPWTQGAAVWVNRVHTGRLEDPSLRVDLLHTWALAGTPDPCGGCPSKLYRYTPWPGEVREQEVVGTLRASDPFVRFATALDVLEEALREHGITQGIPSAGPPA